VAAFGNAYNYTVTCNCLQRIAKIFNVCEQHRVMAFRKKLR